MLLVRIDRTLPGKTAQEHIRKRTANKSAHIQLLQISLWYGNMLQLEHLELITYRQTESTVCFCFFSTRLSQKKKNLCYNLWTFTGHRWDLGGAAWFCPNFNQMSMSSMWPRVNVRHRVAAELTVWPVSFLKTRVSWLNEFSLVCCCLVGKKNRQLWSVRCHTQRLTEELFNHQYMLCNHWFTIYLYVKDWNCQLNNCESI